MAQTSVEWIYNELVVFMTGNSVFESAEELFRHGKEMHKEETIRFIKTMPAYIEISQECKPYVKYDVEAHYNETFNK
jgi:hypothetical protein